jgi:hypothetical protein
LADEQGQLYILTMTKAEIIDEAQHALVAVLGVMLAGMHLRDTPLGQLHPQTINEYDEIRAWFTKITLQDVPTMHSLILNDRGFSVRTSVLSSICLGSIIDIHRAIEQHPSFHGLTGIRAMLPSYRFLWLVRNAFSHDFNLHIKDPKKIPTILPVTWRHITVTSADLRKPVPFTIREMLWLMEDIIIELGAIP